VELTPCGHRSDKNRIKTKFETLQTVEETLFANRKTKEKNCSKQLTKYPFKNSGGYLIVLGKDWSFGKMCSVIIGQDIDLATLNGDSNSIHLY
jgi:hypothetical protein